jgi:hypothetical protein
MIIDEIGCPVLGVAEATKWTDVPVVLDGAGEVTVREAYAEDVQTRNVLTNRCKMRFKSVLHRNGEWLTTNDVLLAIAPR